MDESMQEIEGQALENPETPASDAPKQAIDPEKAHALLNSTASVLNAAAKLNKVTADILDPSLIEEKQAEIEEKKEKRRAQLREAQAKFYEKSKQEAEAQALQIRKLEAEVAAIEGLMTELAELRPVKAEVDAARKRASDADAELAKVRTAKQQIEATLNAAHDRMNKWRVATMITGTIATAATAVAIMLAM